MANSMELTKKLLRVVDVAQYLNLSRSCVYQLMERGELPYVKIGKSRRIKPEDLSHLVANGTSGDTSSK